MSSPPIVINCNGCSFTGYSYIRPIILKCRVGDEVVTYDHSTAWCNQCDKISIVERIPTLEELYSEYDRLLSQIPDTNRNARWSLDRIKELKKRITWRKARTAPPHCLNCGSADITHVDYEEANGVFISKAFRHKCGGALVIDPEYKDPQDLHIRFAELIIWLDIEGGILMREN